MSAYTDTNQCPSCGKYIPSGCELYEIDDLFVCEGCFREWLKDYARTNPSDVAERVGVPVITYNQDNLGR